MVVMAAMLALTVAPAFAGPVLSPAASPTQGVMALVVSLGIALGVAGMAYAVTALSNPEEGADDPVPVRNHPPRVTTTHKVM